MFSCNVDLTFLGKLGRLNGDEGRWFSVSKSLEVRRKMVLLFLEIDWGRLVDEGGKGVSWSSAWKTDKLGCCSYTLDITSILVASTFSCSMDERDLEKAPLNLLHIIEVSVDVDGGGGGKWTERGLVHGFEEVEENVRNFKFITSTKFNHGQPT